jgi:hypothetical protein
MPRAAASPGVRYCKGPAALVCTAKPGGACFANSVMFVDGRCHNAIIRVLNGNAMLKDFQ